MVSGWLSVRRVITVFTFSSLSDILSFVGAFGLFVATVVAAATLFRPASTLGFRLRPCFLLSFLPLLPFVFFPALGVEGVFGVAEVATAFAAMASFGIASLAKKRALATFVAVLRRDGSLRSTAYSVMHKQSYKYS